MKSTNATMNVNAFLYGASVFFERMGYYGVRALLAMYMVDVGMEMGDKMHLRYLE